MKNLLKTICVAMAIAMVGVMMVGCKKNKDEYATEYVYVTLTEAAAGRAEIYTENDFSEIDLLKVEYRDNKQWLTLYLTKPSQKNAKDAVKLLNKRADVKLAYRVKQGAFAA